MKKKRFGRKRKRKKGRVLMQAEPATETIPVPSEQPHDAAGQGSAAVAEPQPKATPPTDGSAEPPDKAANTAEEAPAETKRSPSNPQSKNTAE